MTDSTMRLLDEVLRLSFDERAQLADRLLESLHPPGDDVTSSDLADAWAAELTRRIADSDTGGRTIPAEEVWCDIDARRASRKTGQVPS